jgi:hypothetical protein
VLLRIGLATGCLLVAAVACGDGSTSSPQGDPGTSAKADGGRGDGDGASARSRDDDAPVTLADLVGRSASTEEVAAQVRQAEQERQELVGDCLADQGFEYVVHVAAGQVVNVFGLPTDLPEDEFRRQYGYGIATGFEAALDHPPGAPSDVVEDPNAAIVATMSEAERAAYEQALYGTPGPNGEPGGCEGEAMLATDRAARLIEELDDELDDLEARIGADARLVDAEQAWVDCMADAGYPFADEAAIHEEILRRLNPVNDAAVGEDVPDGVVQSREGMSLTEEQRAELAEVRAFELAVAEADLECRDDLDEVRAEVRAEHEAEFVDAHRDRLRELFPDVGL